MIKFFCSPGRNALCSLALPALLMLALYLAAVFFRPVLPIDETRYLSVAWEMHLRHDWLAPLTVNFQPYHHKPPFLFWMINIFWGVFGINRWAAIIPVVLATLAVAFLTRALAGKLFPDMAESKEFRLLPLFVIGSLPLLVYGTLIMFDVTLTVFVLLALLALLGYAEKRQPVYILLMALALGFGVLTKGPVAWLYVLFPVLLMPYWKTGGGSRASWYGGCFLAYILSLGPVLVWLVPVVQASSEQFAYNLIWEQTAGRITGSMGNTHDRPVWFYLPLVPLFFLPWAFFPSFWRGLKTVRDRMKAEQGIRFLIALLLPTFIAFCLISGKQPHYMVPLVPGLLILIFVIARIPARRITHIAVLMALLFVAGQAVASRTALKAYDLQRLATYVHDHGDQDWAFVHHYHGELTYLARLEKPLDEIDYNNMDKWFAAHPGGFAIVHYKQPEDVAGYDMVFSMPYRGKQIGVFRVK